MHKIPIILLLMIFNSFDPLYAMDIWDACITGNIKRVKLLIEQDSALVNAQSRTTQVPLHVASQCRHAEVVSLLLQHKANVNAQDDYKWTPLQDASRNDHTKTIKLLLSYGATPHKPINLFVRYPRHSQRYAQRYESWICKTFLPRKTITFLLSLIGRQKITDTPLLPKDMRNLIASYALANEVQEWEQFKKDNPDVAALARIELP